MATYGCGNHRAFIYERGGVNRLGEVKPLMSVRWGRIRDEISHAMVSVGVDECCEFLGELGTCQMELHIERSGVGVWQGPITRLEYERSKVDIYGEDITWVMKQMPLAQGYDNTYPAVGDVITRMDWLARDKTFALYGDPWNMVPHLFMVVGPDDPKTTRKTAAWSMSTWEDFDAYAEDHGADYTVVNRDLYYWDISYAWAVLPDLEEGHIAEYPRVVEYGNELMTRSVVTNGVGIAGAADAPAANVTAYGIIGKIDSSYDTNLTPSPQDIARMRASARKQVDAGGGVPPVRIVIPANSTLMPSSPWEVNDLIPGAWFDVRTTSLCRNVVETQRLHEVVVTESAPGGEKVQITCITAPRGRIDVP